MEHREIHPVPHERVHDGEVEVQPVGGELDRTAEPRLQVIDERIGVGQGALTDQPRRDQLGVGVDGDPGPHVAVAGGALEVLGDVLLLGVAERPNLVGLDSPAIKVAKRLVLVVGAGLSEIDQELGDGVLGGPSDPNCATDAHAFCKATNDWSPAFGAEPVCHTHIILDRSSIGKSVIPS